MTFIDLDKPQMNKSSAAKHHSIKSETEMIDEVGEEKNDSKEIDKWCTIWVFFPFWLALEFVTEIKALNKQLRFSPKK